MKGAVFLIYIFSLCIICQAQTFSLSVIGGHGSGSYSEGDTIYIWANPDFNEDVFDKWQGSATTYMLEQNEWLTRIVVPTGSNISSLSATANFNDLSTSVTTVNDIITLPGKNNGAMVQASVDVYYRVPQNPVGIIFCFHGTGGSGTGFETDFEKNAFFKAGANRNYIMVATDANEKTFGDQNNNGTMRWEINDPATDDHTNNIDIKLIKALQDTMINRLSLTSDFPTFAMGTSNGANFADLCAAALGFNASGHMTGNGLPDVYAVRSDSRPVIFVQSINDQNSSASSTVPVDNHNALLNRGISSEFYWHKKTPVYEYRFVRIEDQSVSPKNSDSIYQRMLSTAGLLDSNNKLLIADNSGLPASLFTGLGLSSDAINNCENQIKIINADHKFHSHYNNRIIDFFDMHLSSSTSSVYEAKSTESVIIYPNPTYSIVFISNYNKNTDYSLYTPMGQLLKSNINSPDLDLSEYPNGIYIIKINKGDNFSYKKIIKH